MNVRTHLGAVACASLIGFTATMFGAAPALLPLAAAEESASTHRSVSAGTMQWGVFLYRLSTPWVRLLGV